LARDESDGTTAGFTYQLETSGLDSLNTYITERVTTFGSLMLTHAFPKGTVIVLYNTHLFKRFTIGGSDTVSMQASKHCTVQNTTF